MQHSPSSCVNGIPNVRHAQNVLPDAAADWRAPGTLPACFNHRWAWALPVCQSSQNKTRVKRRRFLRWSQPPEECACVTVRVSVCEWVGEWECVRVCLQWVPSVWNKSEAFWCPWIFYIKQVSESVWTCVFNSCSRNSWIITGKTEQYVKRSSICKSLDSKST